MGFWKRVGFKDAQRSRGHNILASKRNLVDLGSHFGGHSVLKGVPKVKFIEENQHEKSEVQERRFETQIIFDGFVIPKGGPEM